MTAGPDSLQQLDDHLRAAVADPQRGATFDMDDRADDASLAAFSRLRGALTWLEEHVAQPWRTADAAALEQQATHRYVARVAITGGTLAIVFAICQLAVGHGSRGATAVFLWLGLITALTAGVAVGVGVVAKCNRRWLGQRQLAERLRMLKFRSLGHPALWNGNLPEWQSWVSAELAELQGDDQFARVRVWAASDRAEAMDVPVDLATNDPSVPRGLAIYYQHKRVDFQARYYQRQAEKHKSQVMLQHRHSTGVFLASLTCVLLHFVLGFLARHQANPDAARVLSTVATVAVALAAIIPVLGLGARAWTLALEHSRTACRFAATGIALQDACGHLRADSGDLAKTLRHVAYVEHFLEHEHREWLRLLLEAEWFL